MDNSAETADKSSSSIENKKKVHLEYLYLSYVVYRIMYIDFLSW